MSDRIATEQVKALGFESMEQCEEHQAWLHEQKICREKVRAAMEVAEEAGTNIIDLREL